MFFSFNALHVCLLLALTMAGAFTPSCIAAEKTGGPSAAPGEGSGRGVSMRVLWKVSAYHLTDRAAWTEEKARTMLFRPLDIGADTITFAGETCRGVAFSRETVEAEKYLRERFGTEARALGLEKEVIEVVRTTCGIEGFDEYIRLRDRRLLVPMHGVLVVFSPAVNY